MGILTLIGLGSLIFILIYISFRLFLAIISIFIYLTGLAVTLLFVSFTGLILFSFIKRAYRRYKCYKRCELSSRETISLISKFEIRYLFELCILCIILYIFKFIIFL